jgi:hypothetical protein
MAPPNRIPNSCSEAPLSSVSTECDERVESTLEPQNYCAEAPSKTTENHLEWVGDSQLQMSYARPVEVSKSPTNVFTKVSPSPQPSPVQGEGERIRKSNALKVLGNALGRLIQEIESSGEEVDPQIVLLASRLEEGKFPSRSAIESLDLFNQSHDDPRLDVLIHAIAVMVAKGDSVHREALARNTKTQEYLSQSLSEDSLDKTIQQGLREALLNSPDPQTREILNLPSQNQNTPPPVKIENPQVLISTNTGNENSSPVGVATGAAQSLVAFVSSLPATETLRSSAILVVDPVRVTPSVSHSIFYGADFAFQGGASFNIPFILEKNILSASTGNFPSFIQRETFLTSSVVTPAIHSTNSDQISVTASFNSVPETSSSIPYFSERVLNSKSEVSFFQSEREVVSAENEVTLLESPPLSGEEETLKLISSLEFSETGTKVIQTPVQSLLQIAYASMLGGLNTVLGQSGFQPMSLASAYSAQPWVGAVTSSAETRGEADTSGHSDSSGGDKSGRGSEQDSQRDQSQEEHLQPEVDVMV